MCGDRQEAKRQETQEGGVRRMHEVLKLILRLKWATMQEGRAMRRKEMVEMWKEKRRMRPERRTARQKKGS